VYFFNARLKFKIRPTAVTIPGSIIAASAISAVDLERRKFGDYAHFNKKLLDPQLYVATVDPALDPKTVARLAAYPWFHGTDVPKYKSGEYGTRTAWKKKHKADFISKWTRTVPTAPDAIRRAARAAVEFQLMIGCDGILLAVPLTTIADQTLQPELEWIEAGIQACADLKVSCPVYATVALSEAVLHVPALKNPIIHSLSNYIATRSELAGAYIVLEQTDPSNYFWTSKDPLMALLILVDDLVRGAGKKVIVNYVGTFGLVAKAVGAEIWSSGYFLMQRRFSLKGQMGIAHPHYHSLAMAGDIGLKADIARIRDAGLIDKFVTPTSADAVLRTALGQGKTPADVPEWKYAPNNWSAAQEHYLLIVSETGAKLETMSAPQRQDWTLSWLTNAVKLVDVLEHKELVGMATDTSHQKVWLDVFKEWRTYATQ
jgi:hypothetical protein